MLYKYGAWGFHEQKLLWSYRQVQSYMSEIY